ncbi:MAG: molybdate ABC transporter substrate-binding protein [Saprospiraceae bacterium]|nr:molybdate ABC transporter substrate-binding protein [Saprospiraceae bacterium]
MNFVVGCNSNKTKTLRIAVASNLTEPITLIGDNYYEEFETKVEVITGSSGKLMAQILHGAPFDIFISADIQYLDLLKEQNELLDEPDVFVEGRLILWTLQQAQDPDIQLLLSERIKKIAIPNPEIAPYGKAAKEALMKLNMWEQIKHKLVFGESVTQTNQFLLTEAVEAGITSQSLIHSTHFSSDGLWIKIENSLYQPISHGIAILKSSTNIEASKKFIDYINDDNSINLLKEYGYTQSL